MLYHNGAVEISEFPRTLRSLYVPGIDHMYFQKKVRFLMNYLHKGKLFCLKYEDQNIGYCMVSTGKCGRYTYAGKTILPSAPSTLSRTSGAEVCPRRY